MENDASPASIFQINYLKFKMMAFSMAILLSRWFRIIFYDILTRCIYLLVENY